jgi:hypothetical protein
MGGEVMTVDEMAAALLEPLPEKDIYWRVGSTTKDKSRGLALAYMDARGVMRRLDEVFGVHGWQDAYEETPSGRIICSLVCLFDGPVTKSDGAGATDIEGEKGAISDAFKRAAVKFGIGRYLYDLPAVWVPIEPFGRSYRIVPGEEPELPEWARPAGAKPKAKQKKASMPNAEQKAKFQGSINELMNQLDTLVCEDTSNEIFEELMDGTGFSGMTELAGSGTRDDHKAFYKALKKEVDKHESAI